MFTYEPVHIVAFSLPSESSRRKMAALQFDYMLTFSCLPVNMRLNSRLNADKVHIKLDCNRCSLSAQTMLVIIVSGSQITDKLKLWFLAATAANCLQCIQLT